MRISDGRLTCTSVDPEAHRIDLEPVACLCDESTLTFSLHAAKPLRAHGGFSGRQHDQGTFLPVPLAPSGNNRCLLDAE